ncbi:hypothetical protein MBLNU457_1719t1 [Dothideomycetes sp. NU457]
MASDLEPPDLIPASSSSQPSEPSQKSHSQSESSSALDKHISSLRSAHETATTTLATLTLERNKLLSTVLNHQNTDALDTLPAAKIDKDLNEPNICSTGGDPTDDDIESGLETARKIKARHVRELQKYNEIKDIAQGLIGLIAEQRGVRVVDVMREIGGEDLGS